MTRDKKWALLLLGSLVINIFLGGFIAGRWLQSSEDLAHPPPPPAPEAGEAVEGSDPPQEPPPPRAHGPQGDRHPGNKHFRHKAERSDRPSGGAAHDLKLLRHMVRIMGGPEDPRIAAIRDEAREDIKKTRRQMRAAHDRLQATLQAPEFDAAELEASLAELRKASMAAQERAQRGVLELAKVMTPEERRRMASAAAGPGSRPPGPPSHARPKQGGRKP